MKVELNKYGVYYIDPDSTEKPEGHEEIINARIATKEISGLGICNIDIPTSFCKEKVMKNPYVHLYNESVDMCIDLNMDEMIVTGIDKETVLAKWNFWNSEIIEWEEGING